MIQVFNLATNFWTSNPGVRFLPFFKELHDNDETENKEKSSKAMWGAVTYLLENKINTYYRMSKSQRLSQIKKNIDPDFRISRKYYKDILKHVEFELISKMQRRINKLWQKLEERDKLLDETEYTLDNAELLDKLILNMTKLNGALTMLEEQLAKSEKTGRNKGDYRESLSEQIQ